MTQPIVDRASSVVLQHAIRRWQAETENAGRLATRENGILGVIAMLLGLGLFRAPIAIEMEPKLLVWTTRSLLSASALQALAARGLVLWNRPPTVEAGRVAPARLGLASALLVWPGAARHMREVFVDEWEANQVAIRVLEAAANEQHTRNVARKWLLDRAQRYLFGAAICAALAMVGNLHAVPAAGGATRS